MNPETDDPCAPPPTPEWRWRRAAGLQFLGPVQGSGLRDTAYLVRRTDDQVVQLSELLHLVALHVEPPRPSQEVAQAVSAAYGRTLTTEGLEHLITTRLEPMGLVLLDEDAEPLRPPRAQPLLSLTAKGTLITARWTRRLASWLTPAFWPPVVGLVLAALVIADLNLWFTGDFWGAVTELFANPTRALLIYALLTLGAVVHELGHAAACRYGGAMPGEIGVGIYIVFPAFYTDVTDSYRLGRGGRIRTDLGGLHFNVLCVLALAAGHAATGSGVLLLTAVVMQIQMVQQLIPVVRFDGYYVLADLAGVPDLFARVGPVLRSLRPGRPPEPKVLELRPYARRLVTGWVVSVVPLLLFALVWAIWSMPEFVARGRAGLELQWAVLDVAWRRQDWLAMILAILSSVLILIPLVGMAVVLWRLCTIAARWLQSRLSRRNRPEKESMTLGAAPDVVAQGPLPALSAADFTDARMRGPHVWIPDHGWRRAIYRGTAHAYNPGPSRQERQREELRRRLRTPIDGSRRVVVMSRKGGVGKTTIALALGSTFAMLRGDRVIAVDANPDAGNLAHRVAPPHDRNVTDVLRDIDDIDSYAALRGYTSQATESRLEVLASDDDPSIGMALGRTDYHRLIDLLDHYYNLILLDTGTGILDSANQGLLAEADQVVLVLRPGLDGGRAAALTLDWMDEHGYGELVSSTVVVINAERHGGAPPDLMRRHFEKRCEHVVSVPWDDTLEQGAQTDMSDLNRKTRDSMVEIAAAVADNFARLEVRP